MTQRLKTIVLCFLVFWGRDFLNAQHHHFSDSINLEQQDFWFLKGKYEASHSNYFEAIHEFKNALNYLKKKKDTTTLMISYDHDFNEVLVLDTLIDLVSTKWYLQIVYSSLGDAYFSLNDINNALKYYDSSITLYPQQYYAYHKKGEIFTMLNEYDDAIDEFAIAFENKASPLYQFYLGYCFYKLQNYQLCIQNCENALLTNITEVYLKHRANKQNEFDTLKKIINIGDQFPIIYQILGDAYFITNNFTKAIQQFNTLIQKDSTLIEGYYFRGCSFFESGNFLNAIYDFLKVLSLKNYTKNDSLLIFKANIYNNIAYSYSKLGNLIEALSYYDTLIILDPKNPENYYLRGNAYYQQKNIFFALQDFEKALSRSHNIKYVYAKANCNFDLKQYKLAVQNYEKVINHLETEASFNPNPQNDLIIDTVSYKYYPYRTPEVYYKIAFGNIELKKYHQAIDYINVALSKTPPLYIDPFYVTLLDKKAQCYININMLPKAIEIYLKLIDNLPFNASYYLQLAKSNFSLKNYADAIKFYTIVIKADTNNLEAIFQRGVAYFETNRYEQCIQDFKYILALNDQDMLPFYYLGQSYAKLNNVNLAVLNLNAAILLAPNHPKLYLARALAYCQINNVLKAEADFKKQAQLNGKTTFLKCP
ncbi:MAG: tetratricopeptide repeat protein [Alphaproteobacteria bacterium]|nr:tetratricopeptide repeat protein [Alphaproteobacteria bacterium]